MSHDELNFVDYTVEGLFEIAISFNRRNPRCVGIMSSPFVTNIREQQWGGDGFYISLFFCNFMLWLCTCECSEFQNLLIYRRRWSLHLTSLDFYLSK